MSLPSVYRKFSGVSCLSSISYWSLSITNLTLLVLYYVFHCSYLRLSLSSLFGQYTLTSYSEVLYRFFFFFIYLTYINVSLRSIQIWISPLVYWPSFILVTPPFSSLTLYLVHLVRGPSFSDTLFHQMFHRDPCLHLITFHTFASWTFRT